MNSPCAKLTTRITPKMSASPSATSPSSPPMTTPLTKSCRKSVAVTAAYRPRLSSWPGLSRPCACAGSARSRGCPGQARASRSSHDRRGSALVSLPLRLRPLDVVLGVVADDERLAALPLRADVAVAVLLPLLVDGEATEDGVDVRS